VHVQLDLDENSNTFCYIHCAPKAIKSVSVMMRMDDINLMKDDLEELCLDLEVQEVDRMTEQDDLDSNQDSQVRSSKL
jgi:hypothetical protein